MTMGRKRIDLTGENINGIQVVEVRGKAKSGDILWDCVCKCGKDFYSTGSAIKSGRTKSCGCFQIQQVKKSNSTHEGSKTPLYKVWRTMKTRCENPNSEKFTRYGGRGIKVCSEWQDFTVFRDWAIENGYSDELSIDRRDNDGDYKPSNCRWVTMKVQARNTSSNRWIELHGVKKTLAEWSELTGLKRKTISGRLDRGWSDEDALTTPLYSERLKKELNI